MEGWGVKAWRSGEEWKRAGVEKGAAWMGVEVGEQKRETA